MAIIRYSNRAAADLDSVAEYTVRTWGQEQGERYLAQLEAMAQRLAEIPTLGRRCQEVRPGLWRLEVASHVMFFRRLEDGDTFICRILHRSMLPKQHPIDDAEPWQVAG